MSVAGDIGIAGEIGGLGDVTKLGVSGESMGAGDEVISEDVRIDGSGPARCA